MINNKSIDIRDIMEWLELPKCHGTIELKHRHDGEILLVKQFIEMDCGLVIAEDSLPDIIIDKNNLIIVHSEHHMICKNPSDYWTFSDNGGLCTHLEE